MAMTKQVELTWEEERVEKLAMFLVDELRLLPSRPPDRLSGGHGWHRTHADERETFRKKAKAMLDLVT